jgi:hypothetical protein
MTMLVKPRLAGMILSAINTFPVIAQDDLTWDNLGTLKLGNRIGIIQSDRRWVEGRFAGFSDSGISIRADQLITIRKAKVILVCLRPRARRSLRVIVGTAIGAGAGVLLTATVGQRLRNEGQNVPASAWIAGGAAVGAGVGALRGGRYGAVYLRSQ